MHMFFFPILPLRTEKMPNDKRTPDCCLDNRTQLARGGRQLYKTTTIKPITRNLTEQAKKLLEH